jgi:hypothetical protein
MGSRGGDYIKVDINYLNRVPLLPTVQSACTIDPALFVVGVVIQNFCKKQVISTVKGQSISLVYIIFIINCCR